MTSDYYWYLKPRFYKDQKTSREVIKRAIELGCNHFDTADVYGYGQSETVLSEFLKVNPNIRITTKIGWNFYNFEVKDKTKRYLLEKLQKNLELIPYKQNICFSHELNFNPTYLDFALEESLKRLGRNYIDILLLHMPTVKDLQSNQWEKYLIEKKRQGKCLVYGLSLCSPIEVYTAIYSGIPEIIQVPISLVNNEPMLLALEMAKSKGIKIIGREIFHSGNIFSELKRVLPEISNSDISKSLIYQVLENQIVDHLLIGCTSTKQVEEILNLTNIYEENDPSLNKNIKIAYEKIFSDANPILPTLDSTN
ncbi:aldo/keto reductase [Bacillaceae bacterium SIJ1]|uniref:aldo/keto reductase n=1 Tax=Litoribacterium kuwaitense TaxID=1398745 RepID=UPI0013ED8A1B|nr:aldo/keto reductase [Litoribacterium kuwaitense]NGP46769.1 aldo/keto reductase [Litoribacterium kuwaitense]